ncbi:MAG: M17 family peptidase N-terminal domain-containing protein [Polyangiales bacterium]
MIAYDFISAAPGSLDELQTEVIVLPFFSDERPLRGAAGLIDWRLCGALSRKLMAGYLRGTFGEKALLANLGKLKSDRLLLVGLGESASFDHSVAQKACALIAEALREAQVSTAALALPGRSVGLMTAREAMQVWLAASPVDSELEELSIIELAQEHRALDSLFDGLRRQAESPLD